MTLKDWEKRARDSADSFDWSELPIPSALHCYEAGYLAGAREMMEIAAIGADLNSINKVACSCGTDIRTLMSEGD